MGGVFTHRMGVSSPAYTANVNFGVIDFLSASATGSLQYTSADLGGKTPGAYITMASLFDPANDGGSQTHMSWGFHMEANNGSGFGIANLVRHNLATTDTYRNGFSGAAALQIMSNAAGTGFNIGNIDPHAGGISVNWTNVTLTGRRCAALVIAGDDVQAYSGSVDPNRGTVDVTSVGFEPDIVLFTAYAGTFNSASNGANFDLGIVVNDGSDTQFALQSTALDAQAAGFQNTPTASGRVQTWYSTGGYSVGSFDASGFTISHAGTSNATLDSPLAYLALKVGDRPFALQALTPPTATGVTQITCGFRPRTAIIVLRSYDDGFGIGFVTANNQWAHVYNNDNGADPTVARQAFRNAAIAAPTSAGTLAVIGNFSAFTSTGMEIDWTATVASGVDGFVLLIG